MFTYDSLDAISEQKLDITTIPEFDARQHGWVTPAKNQGRCGACWAHAAVETIESRILKDNGPQYIVSVQQQVSCNLSMNGCCGGSGRSLLFYYNNKPWLMKDVPYSESDTQCPTQRTKQAGDFNCAGINYLASGFYTVEVEAAAMKRSILEHGPCYFRYNVYDDFYDHWLKDMPGSVYTEKTGKNLGGHAVLIIGWSDAKGAWLLKNSWGSDTGPDKDGMFWAAYEGHANNLGFQMFNITTLHKTS
jgi:cathepsin L